MKKKEQNGFKQSAYSLSLENARSLL